MLASDLLKLVDPSKLSGGKIISCDITSKWIGHSICWVPDSIPADILRRPLYTVVSSRIGRYPHRRPGWFAMLERAFEFADRDGAWMAAINGTASAPWVLHAARLFRGRGVNISVSDWNQSFETWLERLYREPPADNIAISPAANSIPKFESFPRRDVFAIGAGKKVFAPLVRIDGNVDRLLHRRLSNDSFEKGSVWVALSDENQSASKLIQSGAVGWITQAVQGTQDSEPTQSESFDNIFTLQELLQARCETESADAWPYLVHCTRENTGVNPSQTPDAYRDSLLLSRETNTAGPMATLEKIVAEGQLRAGTQTTRGEAAVICFSAHPLQQLLGMRKFQSHLGRWDFEPYGIAIRRESLKQRACRPVIYGNDTTYRALDEADRPFFQSSGQKNRWTSENEWRRLGNVKLPEIAVNDAFLFVPSLSEARRLAPKCRWPIVVVDV